MFEPVNLNKPNQWKSDIALSVDMYNQWFMKFAPAAYRDTRVKVAKDVEDTLKATDNLKNVSAAILREKPSILPTLRMSTCPPLAVDRLIGLAGVPGSLVGVMEKAQKLPKRLVGSSLDVELNKIGTIIEKMADPDIFVWFGRTSPATELEIQRASTIIADRLCGSVANPIIRNAQEKRQLAIIESWLKNKGYKPSAKGVKFEEMEPGTFAFRINVSVSLNDATKINIPVDTVIIPHKEAKAQIPLLVEAKSAGDFTNVNKRRKEEAAKMSQIRKTYGNSVQFILFLCGYFDSGYLGYEAAEGIDWIWEHRIDDFEKFGL